VYLCVCMCCSMSMLVLSFVSFILCVSLCLSIICVGLCVSGVYLSYIHGVCCRCAVLNAEDGVHKMGCFGASSEFMYTLTQTEHVALFNGDTVWWGVGVHVCVCG